MDYLALKRPIESIDDDTTTQINSQISISDDDDSSIFQLALSINKVNEELLLAQYGYIKQQKISDILQGELFIAVNKNRQNNEINESVAIKKVSKTLHSKRESVDIDGFRFVVDEDIIKEALILKHLTMNNKCIGDSIVKYIDFFESQTDYYLVMQYIESNINLKDFVIESMQYIKNGKLNLKEYQKIIKYILWQLIATIHWLHNDMKCCHLDICPENIMLKHVKFLQNTDGTVSINPQIEVKLIDFGCSEQFDIDFKCNKQYLSLENEQYLSPNIYNNEYYDARASDMWSFGMIIYYCFIGKYPFHQKEETEFNHEPKKGTAYCSVYNGKLKQYLSMNNLLKLINPNLLLLLNGLLNIDEKKRFKTINVLQHKWFNYYYKIYGLQIYKKSMVQKNKLLHQTQFLSKFPYYRYL